MRRSLIAVIAVSALALTAGAPTGAQTIGNLELDDHEGVPGDLVTGRVTNLSVVEEECATTPEQLYPSFFNFEGETNQAWSSPGPVFADWMAGGPLIGLAPPEDGDWGVFPPFGAPADPPADVEPEYWAWRWWHNFDWTPPQTREIQAARFMWYFMDILGGQDAGGAAGAEALLPQTFVFTFADIQTEEPVGDLSHFDPNTGESVEEPPLLVPDVAPGIWPVIATCVEFQITEESFLAAIEAGAAWLEENEIDPDLNAPLSAAAIETILAPMLEDVLPELVAIGGGPWIDLYCVLDDDGVCHPELRGIDIEDLTEEQLEQLEEFGEVVEEDGLVDPDGDPDLVIAETTPRFTG